MKRNFQRLPSDENQTMKEKEERENLSNERS
jgi:hypothetical protein